jgi:hypothetical protein
MNQKDEWTAMGLFVSVIFTGIVGVFFLVFVFACISDAVAPEFPPHTPSRTYHLELLVSDVAFILMQLVRLPFKLIAAVRREMLIFACRMMISNPDVYCARSINAE